MELPLNEIKDGHLFQRIIAEYFRSLDNRHHEHRNAGVKVYEGGIGPDDGCDIMVEIFFEDAISSHSQKWVVECKCLNKTVGKSDLNTNNLETLLQSKGATGYLLVCKSDATSSLRRLFADLNNKQGRQYVIWNGTQLWHKIISSSTMLEAFFPEYYRIKFIENNAKDQFDSLIQKFEKEIGQK